MDLFIVRHTKVDVPVGTCYGQSDVGLADSFPSEFENIKLQLEGIAFDYSFTSPLSRCKTLSQFLEVNLKQAPFKIDKNLMELNFGDWEMSNWKSIEQSEQAQFWFKDFIRHSTPNGESYMDLMARIEYFIDELKLLPDTAKVLIVTHGGAVRAFHTIIKQTGVDNAFDLNVDYGEIIKLSL